MAFNAQQYAEKHGVNKRRIKEWYDVGYLGNATRGESGVYDIPEDTPVPYKADKRVSRLPTFWLQLLDAAQKQQSIFPSMYPKLQNGTVDRCMADFSEAGLIRIVQTQSGASFLELTTSGYQFMNTLGTNEKKKAFEKISRAITTGCTLIQALCSV